MKDYPAVKTHLDSFEPKLSQRCDQGDTPYNLRRCAYMNDFSKPKIVWGEISDKTKFALDKNGDFCAEATTFLMTGSDLTYLVCYLNSSLSEYLFSKIGTTTGVGTVRWKKFKIEQLVIPDISPKQKEAFSELLESEINEEFVNHAVFDLCGLTPEEIRYISSVSE